MWFGCVGDIVNFNIGKFVFLSKQLIQAVLPRCPRWKLSPIHVKRNSCSKQKMQLSEMEIRNDDRQVMQYRRLLNSTMQSNN